MISVADVRRITSTLPRSYEVVVRDRIKFRIGRIVYLAFSRDETVMGFAFPKQERDGLIASDPDKFMLPGQSDMRYNWVHVRLDAIDLVELARDRRRGMAHVCAEERCGDGALTALEELRCVRHRAVVARDGDVPVSVCGNRRSYHQVERGVRR